MRMQLSERLSQEMKQAMRDKDKTRLSVIRMVRSAMKYREIETGDPLTDEDIVVIVQKELKQRRDSLQAFESAGRTDLAEATRSEIDVLMDYLPKQMSEDELRELITAIISEIGASGKSDTGKVMSKLMPQIRGRADGKLAQSLVQTLLHQ
jgi:uncharacterized protein YqeY